MQPQTVSGGGGQTREDKVKEILEDILDKLQTDFDMKDMYMRVEERTPYVSVCLQECGMYLSLVY